MKEKKEQIEIEEKSDIIFRLLGIMPAALFLLALASPFLYAWYWVIKIINK